MDLQAEDSSCSEDLGDLHDVPMALSRHPTYEDEPPPTSRGLPDGFNRPGFGFHLNLTAPVPDESESPRLPNGLQGMRSEPVYLPETSRPRQPPTLALAALAQGRGNASFTGAAQADEGGQPLFTRRGPLKPPMLNLANPASASPVPSGAPTPVFHGGPAAATTAAALVDSPTCRRGPSWAAQIPMTSRGRVSRVQVDLLSSAFILQSPRAFYSRSESGAAESGGAPEGAPPPPQAAAAGAAAPAGERILQQCSSQLGVDSRDLQLYELRPLDAAAVPESCAHVGVMVRGSTFSLAALEDMLGRIKRDEQLTSILDGALRDSSQHAAEAKQNAEKLSKQNEELAVLRERLRAADAVNQQLREQLARSDEHRQLLGATIRTIKREFEDFKARVVVGVVAAEPAAHSPSAPFEDRVPGGGPSVWDSQLPPLQQLSLGASQGQGLGAGQGRIQGGSGGGGGAGGGGSGSGGGAATAPTARGSGSGVEAAAAAAAAAVSAAMGGGHGGGGGIGHMHLPGSSGGGGGGGSGSGGGGMTHRGDPPPLRRGGA